MNCPLRFREIIIVYCENIKEHINTVPPHCLGTIEFLCLEQVVHSYCRDSDG